MVERHLPTGSIQRGPKAWELGHLRAAAKPNCVAWRPTISTQYQGIVLLRGWTFFESNFPVNRFENEWRIFCHTAGARLSAAGANDSCAPSRVETHLPATLQRTMNRKRRIGERFEKLGGTTAELSTKIGM